MDQKKVKQFLKASFGNIVEWYDFSLFAYYTAAMGAVFFPKAGLKESIAGVFLVFGVGFISRPLGGYFLGKIGDKYGRHYAVSIAVYGMSIASLFIAFLPGYHRIGVLAIVLLVILRLIQGLSAGGQFSGLVVIASDVTKKRRALLASLSYSISTLGFLLAISIAYLISVLTPAAFSSSEWRIAFIVSGILGLIYHVINKNNLLPIKTYHSTKLKRLLILEIIRIQWRGFFGIILLIFLVGGMYFFAYSYFYTYLTEVLDFKESTAYEIGIILLCIGSIMYPVFGVLADRFNKQMISIFGAIAALPFAYLFVHANNLYLITLWGIALVLCHAAIVSGSLSISAEVFFQKWRMTASATAYNIGTAFSGFYPAFCQYTVNHYGRFSLIYLVIATIILGLLAHLMVRLSKGHQYIT